MEQNTLHDALVCWNALQPLSKEDEWRLQRKFVTDFNYNSNHIEGNTLTYGQTEVLLLFGKTVSQVDIHDAEFMKAHAVCLTMVREALADGMKALTGAFIRQLHQTMLRADYQVHRNLPGGITTSYTVHAGKYKTRHNSVITRYGERFDYASPEETPAMMTDLVDWYNEERSADNLTPSQLAALFHYRFIRIHPFEDGNGRIARLLMNFILASFGYPMLVVRSRMKNDYLDALHATDLQVGPEPSRGARATVADAEIFVRYFQSLLAEEAMMNCRFLTEHDEQIWWFDGLPVKFRSTETPRMLRIMQAQPSVSIRSLATQLGINKSAVQKQIKRLVEKGYIVQQPLESQKWYVAMVNGK